MTVRRSLTIGRSVTSSGVKVGDYLIIRGDGRIYGGSISAGKGVEGGEIGTPIGVATALKIGLSPFLREFRLKQEDRCRRREQDRLELKRELDPLITEYKGVETLQILGKDYEKQMLADLLRLDSEIAELQKEAQRLSDPDRYCLFDGAALAVRGIIHPGVAIHFGEVGLTEDIGRVAATYTRKRGDLAVDVDTFKPLGVTLPMPSIV